MRLLIDGRCLLRAEKSGVGTYLSSLLPHLPALMPDVEIIVSTTGSKMIPLDLPEGIRQQHRSVPNRLLTAGMTLIGRPSLTDLFPGADLLFLPNLAITGRINKPYILTIHDLSWKIFPEFFSPRMRAWHAATRPERLIREARRIIVPSESTKKDLEYFFGTEAGKITVIPHGVDAKFGAERAEGAKKAERVENDEQIHKRYELPERYILFVGTLEPRKNIDLILDAVEQYRRRTKDPISLLFVGPLGWQTHRFVPALRRAIAQGWARHLGYVSMNDLPTLYRGASVFLWPSFYEGFGLPVLEAMACGNPVITSFTSSLPELVQDAAVMVDAFNPMDTVVALEQVLGSTELQERMRKSGAERARGFGWGEAARHTSRLLVE